MIEEEWNQYWMKHLSLFEAWSFRVVNVITLDSKCESEWLILFDVMLYAKAILTFDDILLNTFSDEL